MRLPRGQHLAYCTNIHPAETWPETLAALEEHTLAVRARVCPNQPFGIGLRLAQVAARVSAITMHVLSRRKRHARRRAKTFVTC